MHRYFIWVMAETPLSTVGLVGAPDGYKVSETSGWVASRFCLLHGPALAAGLELIVEKRLSKPFRGLVGAPDGSKVFETSRWGCRAGLETLGLHNGSGASCEVLRAPLTAPRALGPLGEPMRRFLI